jgi:oligopeptide/dipeptide ABC transporter, ATP-binding protein, C-terminal domain
MIFITHELPLLYHVADDIAVMYAGQLVETGTSEEVIINPIHPYSHALMGSIIVPEAGMKEQKLKAIPGAPPNLKNILVGCRFAERCLYAEARCREGVIEEREQGSRRYRCWRDSEQLKEMYAHE